MGAIDWRAQRGTLVLVAIAVAVGVAAAGGALRFHAEAMRTYDREKGRLEATRSRYRSIDEQKRSIEAWLPAFRSLQAAGVIGEERRLEWIEALRASAARVALPSLRYRIEPRTTYEAGIDLEVGGYGAFSTVMRLDVGLLHEGDLVRLIRDLADGDAGLVRIERCDVRRAGPDFVMRSNASNLTATCDLRWITLARTEARQ